MEPFEFDKMANWFEKTVRSRDSLWNNQRFELDRIFVGYGECSFVAIVNGLSKSSSAGDLFTKLIDVARSLEIPYDNLLSLRNGLASGRMSYRNALFHILVLWSKMQFMGATLGKLISTLEENHLNDCADLLERIFYKHTSSSSVIHLRQEAGKQKATLDDQNIAIPNSKRHDSKQSDLPFLGTLQREEQTSKQNVSGFPRRPKLPNIQYEEEELDLQMLSIGTKQMLRNEADETSPSQQYKETLIDVEGTDARYDLTIKLGNGATSNVYKGFYGEIPAAVKIVESGHFEHYKNEINVWQEMKQTIEEDNLNIITLHCWQPLNTSQFLIVMERAVCDLKDRVKDLKSNLAKLGAERLKKERFQIVRFINEAAKGIKWMHECQKPIIHRDVKPENILICTTRSGEIAKLGDFGLSRKLRNSSAGTTTGGKGTLRWMAPEAIKAFQFEKKYETTKAVDIFSLGMTAHFAMSLGTHPFERSKKHGIMEHSNISDENIMPTVLGPPNYAANHLLQWMMIKVVDGRPTIQQVVHHPCFWEWRRAKEFIMGVAKCFDGAHGCSIAKEMDTEYKLRIGEPVNWVNRLDKDIQTTLFDHYKKKDYRKRADSIMKLVELMRDKNMHHADMIKHSKTEYFKSEGSFDEEKYWNYFLTTYPELVIHLFCQIANQNESLLNGLKKNYFVGFDKVPDWKC